MLNNIRIRVASLSQTIRKMTFMYPIARRDDTVQEDYFGTKVSDPYRWLEDPDCPETQEFVDAQNAVTRPYIDSYSFKQQIKEQITKLWNYPKYSTPFRHGQKYYQFHNTGLQNQSVIYVMNELMAEGDVFFDPNILSEDGTVALSNSTFSEDGNTLAYGLSTSGSDWLEIKFKNAKTGQDYEEVLSKVKYSPMTWMHDNKGFFYGAYLDHYGKADGSETKTSENQKLYYHKLGTDQSEDIVVVDFEDPQLRIGAEVSHCGNYLIVTSSIGCKNNLLYFAHLDTSKEITEKLELNPIVTEYEADYDYITNFDNKFYFRTNKNASNYRAIIIDFKQPEESKWVDFISENANDVLNWVHPINNNMFVVCYLQHVKDILLLYNIQGEQIYKFPLDVGTVSMVSGKKHHQEMFYSFCSFLTPNMIFKVRFDETGVREQTLFHETKVGNFDSSNYQTKQIFYKSKDGTDVPMFLIHKRDFMQDGNRPCLLYGYGGFNVSMSPSFGISRLVFIENFDGIYAMANIRGGGEYGDRWHNGGRFEKKQNCFDDFQYAAKYLVEHKYTAVDKLTIQGGSNGGLLTMACVTQTPELFGAAICQVGVLDMLRFHKFTIGYAWVDDFGSADVKEQFEYLYKYSPLHNINVPEDRKQYPAVLLLTADHDDRVVPLHSLKFIAELQHKFKNYEHQKNPLMIRIETRAGHGAGKPTSKVIDEITDIFAFIGKSLNLKFSS